MAKPGFRRNGISKLRRTTILMGLSVNRYYALESDIKLQVSEIALLLHLTMSNYFLKPEMKINFNCHSALLAMFMFLASWTQYYSRFLSSAIRPSINPPLLNHMHILCGLRMRFSSYLHVCASARLRFVTKQKH